MNEIGAKPISGTSSKKTVQEYIDEIPIWPDGTQLTKPPMTGMQWRIWGLAIAGKFFEGLVVFMTGVALPLIKESFGLGATQLSFVTAASLFGILIGATVLGGMADVFGRKKMFIAEMVLFTLFLAAFTVAQSFIWLLICLFGIGLALGCDYPYRPHGHLRSGPQPGTGRVSPWGLRLSGCRRYLRCWPGHSYSIFPPAVGRLGAGCSPWQSCPPSLSSSAVSLSAIAPTGWSPTGRMKEAVVETHKLLKREPQYPKIVDLLDPHISEHHGDREEPERHIAVLFDKDHRRATFLASIPWFLQDLSTYGIGIFTPVILALTIGAAGEVHDVPGIVHKVRLAATGTAMLDVLLILGILAAIFLVERAGRIQAANHWFHWLRRWPGPRRPLDGRRP